LRIPLCFFNKKKRFVFTNVAMI